MSNRSQRHSTLELIGEVGNLVVGLGLMVTVGAPFVLPALLLVALLMVPLVAVVTFGAVAALPVVLVRRLRGKRRTASTIHGAQPATGIAQENIVRARG